MTDRPACAETRQLLPELAAGIAAPDERAKALRHIAGCGGCHRELEAQTALVDELLHLVPERQPPAGFEAATLAPMLHVRARRPRRLRTVILMAASAVLIAGTAGGAVWQHTESDRELAGNYRRTLAVADGQYLRTVPINGTSTTPSGYVFAYQGSPAWVFVTMTRAQQPGDYRISLTTRDGREVGLGQMAVRDDGRGSWGKTIPIAVHDVLVIHFRNPAGGELIARFR